MRKYIKRESDTENQIRKNDHRVTGSFEGEVNLLLLKNLIVFICLMCFLRFVYLVNPEASLLYVQ